MYLEVRQLDKGLFLCEANGHYSIEDMFVAQKKLASFIDQHGGRQSVVMLDLRTATMPLDVMLPSTWKAFFEIEHPSTRAYVLIGKYMYLGIYGNLLMRIFNKRILYARTVEQAEKLAREFIEKHYPDLVSPERIEIE